MRDAGRRFSSGARLPTRVSRGPAPADPGSPSNAGALHSALYDEALAQDAHATWPDVDEDAHLGAAAEGQRAIAGPAGRSVGVPPGKLVSRESLVSVPARISPRADAGLVRSAEKTTAERMHIVVTGHVDHGKSTSRRPAARRYRLASGGKARSRPRDTCERNAKPFEYAFLLDALRGRAGAGHHDRLRARLLQDARDGITSSSTLPDTSSSSRT